MTTRPATRLFGGLLAVLLTGCSAASTPVPSPATGGTSPAGSSAPRASMTPSGPAGPGGQQPGGSPADGPQYTIEQAVSDRAQENTIAFDALGFLTGNLGADSFFPPGKVADFWGFQYLRDNDPSEMGHNTDFLTRASIDTLAILTSAQRQQLITLAKAQVTSIQDYGYKRFVQIGRAHV